ncbi:MAG: MurR/RpiR family transcriptional regulator [Ignavibacteria bacterium]|nr:MurR/RpiR family transcriptional regulator [Ignavibacteria bacterium]
MVRYSEIKKVIQKHYEELPKNHQKIADYFIENFDRIPFLSIHQVAKAASASVASIVRFAQRIGFDGFNTLREEIAHTLQNHLHNKKTFPLLENNGDEMDVFTSVANQDISNINETLRMNDGVNFEKVIENILASEKVFTVGLGISHLLAQILSYQLNQVGIFSNTFTNNHATFLEQILFMNKKDLLIAFSFPPYSKETVDAARFAKKRDLRVIAITNRPSSPITLYSENVLVVKSENMLFTNSFSAISVLINAIATECAVKNKSRAKQMIEDFKLVSKIQQNIIE